MSHSVKNKYEYQITDQLGTYLAEVLGEGELTMEYTASDGVKLDYNVEMGGTATFTGDDYDRFLLLEESQYRCEFVNIVLRRKCTGETTYTDWFPGVISLNNGEWDLDRKSVKFKITVIDPGESYDRTKGDEHNIFTFSPARYIIKMAPTNVQVETVEYIVDEQPPGFCEWQWQGSGDPYAQKWVVYYHRCESMPLDPNGNVRVTTRWAREYIVLPCNVDPGPVWQLAENNCGTTNTQKWVKEATTYECQYIYPTPQDSNLNGIECRVIGIDSGTNVTQIRNTMKLYDILLGLLQAGTPGMALVSDFFQWNPDVPSTTNYVTGLASKVLNVFIAQKSDVKRPTSASSATRGVLTADKLVTGLCNIFNLGYRVENRAGVSTFRLEHVSRFNRVVGLDLTKPKYDIFMKGMRRYSYESDKIPSKEEFKLMEAGSNADFQGTPITYSGGCVSKTGRDQVKTFAVDFITTDIQYIISNPAPDNKAVSDEGFALIVADYFAPDYVIKSEAGILSTSAPNNPLAWAQLHRDYWRHKRPLRNGIMNGEPTTMLSVIPLKKGVPVEVPFCCKDFTVGDEGIPFSPFNKVRTALGDGTVQKATINTKKDTITLDLLYPANEELEQNQPPVANNDNYTFFGNHQWQPLPILDNDVDPEGIITSIEIEHGRPIFGELRVEGLNVYYRNYPAMVFDRFDFFYYRIRDKFNVASNLAVVTLNVLSPISGPRANPDEYNVVMNVARAIDAPGPFANDLDNVGFTLQSYDSVGPSGGTLVLNADGSLLYTPASGFTGNEVFNYTIVDANSNTASTTITFKVNNANMPFAVDDQRATAVNRQLVLHADDSVMNNDTNIGSAETVPASGATTQGGTYEIYTTGIFTYNPPANFYGSDSFDYQLRSLDQTLISEPATVSIEVHPLVYVSIETVDITHEDKFNRECGDGNTYAGYTETGRKVVRFWSNAGKTVPVDVSTYKMRIRWQRMQYFSYGGPPATTDTFYVDAVGTSVAIYDGMLEDMTLDCDQNITEYYRIDVSLLQLSSYQI